MTKKDYILEKAECLFAEKGFDATSVRDIAGAAGINIAMISYYFGSKEKLMEELFKMRMSVGFAYIKEIVDDDNLNISEKINKVLAAYVERVKKNSKFYHVILAEQATNKNRNVIRFLNKSKKVYVTFFENLIEEGKKSGVVKSDIDPVFFMATVTGTIMHALLNKEFYLKHYGLKSSDGWNDEVYFDKVKSHLELITKSILVYEL
ncbi:TetR/AcrR family transcriptional regulator [Niabella insulamsoli]|uniref:TetR/AcrR family transcriptional regulator n=1 Tax=Niabella insulamsoli TaxID=3144874 RepID=UPI0031FCB3C3